MASFEMGVQLLKNMLIKKKSYSAFFADESDALHKAFPAKATVHAGSVRDSYVMELGTKLSGEEVF